MASICACVCICIYICICICICVGDVHDLQLVSNKARGPSNKAGLGMADILADYAHTATS